MQQQLFPEFVISSGEEGSDPWVPIDGVPTRVDEFSLSGHLERMDEDLRDVAALGIKYWRYGMPWRLSEPAHHQYDWTLWDQAFAACEQAGLEPIVDLCHFGLPDHYNGFLDPSWIDGFVAYTEAFLARYSSPRFFTPVNEPGITATFSALFGMWNDAHASEESYAQAVSHVVCANLEALAAIRADRDGWWIGAEGFSCNLANDDDVQGQAEAAQATAIQYLVWDLHFGLTPLSEAQHLVKFIEPDMLKRINRSVGVVPNNRIIAGHDLYPISVSAFGTRAERPITIEDRVTAYERVAADWYARYGVDFWVAETSNLGLEVEEGPEWLTALYEATQRMRAAGLPVRGICWYSRGDQFDWQTALTVPIGEVTKVGLFTQMREARPVAKVIANLARTHSA